MKRLSLKTRLVLFHTGLMTLVVCLVLAVLFSAGSQEILANVQGILEERVSESMDQVEYRQGRLDFDTDLLNLENGVYLSVYEPGNSSLLYGRLPYGFDYDLPFSSGELRSVTTEEAQFYVLDLEFPVEGYGDLLLRGVVSLSDAERDFRFMLRVALILFPLLILLTAVCGYLLSRRALEPVSRITRTVQKIREQKDLSQRVRLGEGRDEIYTLAQTFDSLLDAIEEGLNREKQFASDVAHELRTPLAVVQLRCEELLARGELPEDSRREVEAITQKTRSMGEMISQLLLLSRADQGRQPLSLEELDLSELSQLEAEEFGEIAGEKGKTLEADIQPGIFLRGDQTLLLRLWGNLLQNGVTYGREQGHMRMRLFRRGEWAVLQVEDDGPGIAPEHLPRLWDRFYQADPARRGDGSGLGLAMVKWIAQAHGGAVSVESQVGKGTVFTVELPLAGPPGPEEW